MEHTEDLNRTARDAEFKDESPLKTVERIKSILRSHGIETEEYWNTTGVPYCFGITIRVAGTTFSVNGKGLTREFALASGYGELMERLQLGFIGKFDVQKDGHHTADTSRYILRPAQELLEENRPWYARIAQRLHAETGSTISPEEILSQCTDESGQVPTDLFYNLTTGKPVCFPKTLWSRVYSSNGCAAGNTMEEALVQAFSEIVERQYRTRIVLEDIHLPQIPDRFLQRFEIPYRIISYIRDQGFRVVVKDCSLGTKFPVVCVCFIDTNSGRYHTHFGAYPIFEIALTRALTETFQGRNIAQFAAFTDFTQTGSRSDLLTTMKHEFVRGTWEKPASFFAGDPDFAFREDVGFAGRNNQELLQECVDFFTAQGYELLVRDGSSLGFHTYQIIIPGYSEVFTYRLDKKLYEFRYFPHAVKALRNPSRAGFDNLLGLMMHMDRIKSSVGKHSFLAAAKLSADLTAAEEDRLMKASLAYVHYAMGQYDAVVKYLNALITPGCAHEEYLICLKRYLTAQLDGTDDAAIRETLQFFHREETVRKLYGCLDANGNPLECLTLRCDMRCTEDCPIRHKCCQKRVTELTRLINTKITALDFDAFCQNLHALL